MKFGLLTTYKFLLKTFEDNFQKDYIKILKNENELISFLDLDEISIVLIHLDILKNPIDMCKYIVNNYPSKKIIVIRNVTDFLEGCTLLQIGIKAYVNSVSNHLLFNQIFDAVNNNNVWVYPELMQYIINQIPQNISKNSVDLSSLTKQEKKVALFIADGLSNAKIAEVMKISEKTVKKYLTSIYEKLELTDRLSLALYIKNNK